MATLAAEVLKLLEPEGVPMVEKTKPEQDECKQSAADLLLKLVKEARIDLFKDEVGIGYASLPVDLHWEIHQLNGKYFRLWLNRLYYQKIGKALSAETLRTVAGTLQAMAVFDGKTHRLELRIAKGLDGAFWYDLGTDDWAAIRIDNSGYSVRNVPPVLFQRKANTSAQEKPKKGGIGIYALLDFVNVKNQADQRLLLVYVCLCLVPGVPRFVLVSHGENGSGKSFLLRLIRRIIDPAGLELMTLPHDKGELALTLASNQLCCFDNIDHLQAWQSDMLCCAATGGGVKKRELYSDSDEVFLKFRHSVALSGISNVATRPDLMDRAILVELSRIESKDRKTEAEIESEFVKVLPGILDDVFTTIAKARTILQTIKTRNLPRMADSARWGAAIAEALGIGADQFFDDLARNGAVANDETIRSSPTATAILAFMKERKHWTGTPSELLKKLAEVADGEGINVHSRSWPNSAESLGKKIRFVKSNLLEVGIGIDYTRSGKRLFEITNSATVSEVTKKPS